VTIATFIRGAALTLMASLTNILAFSVQPCSKG
jgi:hypothetical protein